MRSYMLGTQNSAGLRTSVIYKPVIQTRSRIPDTVLNIDCKQSQSLFSWSFRCSQNGETGEEGKMIGIWKNLWQEKGKSTGCTGIYKHDKNENFKQKVKEHDLIYALKEFRPLNGLKKGKDGESRPVRKFRPQWLWASMGGVTKECREQESKYGYILRASRQNSRMEQTHGVQEREVPEFWLKHVGQS